MRYLYKYTLVASILVFSLFCLVVKLKITSAILEIILYSAIAMLCYNIFFKVILWYRQLMKLKKCMKKRFSYVLVQWGTDMLYSRSRILNIYMFKQGNSFEINNERQIKIRNELVRVGHIEIKGVNVSQPELHFNTVSYYFSPYIRENIYGITINESDGFQNMFKSNRRVFREEIGKGQNLILSIDDMYAFFANNVLLIGTSKRIWLELFRYLRDIEIYIKSCEKGGFGYFNINDKDRLSTEIRYNLRPILRNKRIEGYY